MGLLFRSGLAGNSAVTQPVPCSTRLLAHLQRSRHSGERTLASLSLADRAPGRHTGQFFRGTHLIREQCRRRFRPIIRFQANCPTQRPLKTIRLPILSPIRIRLQGAGTSRCPRKQAKCERRELNPHPFRDRILSAKQPRCGCVVGVRVLRSNRLGGRCLRPIDSAIAWGSSGNCVGQRHPHFLPTLGSTFLHSYGFSSLVPPTTQQIEVKLEVRKIPQWQE